MLGTVLRDYSLHEDMRFFGFWIPETKVNKLNLNEQSVSSEFLEDRGVSWAKSLKSR